MLDKFFDDGSWEKRFKVHASIFREISMEHSQTLKLSNEKGTVSITRLTRNYYSVYWETSKEKNGYSIDMNKEILLDTFAVNDDSQNVVKQIKRNVVRFGNQIVLLHPRGHRDEEDSLYIILNEQIYNKILELIEC